MIKFHRPKMLAVLKAIKLVLYIVMAAIFINFNAKLSSQATETKTVADSTNKIVKSQGDILAAIKAVTDDTHITAAQQTAIIICMLQVPIQDRTTDLQSQCRDHATAITQDSDAQKIQSSNGTVGSVSSPNTTPISPTSQPNKSPAPQPAPQSLIPGVSKPIIGCITKGVCI